MVGVRGAYAKDKDGKTVLIGNEKAVCFCMLGAISKVVPGLSREAIVRYDQATNAVHSLLGTVDMTVWNDAPERTQSEVVKALTMAAELAE